MKKLHIIHTKNLEDISSRTRGKVLPLLETETFDWASQHRKKAYQATLEVQKQLSNGSDDKTKNKYFKYLRRLLELKLEALEEEAHKADKPNPEVNKDLAKWLNFESLRIPEHISCSSISMYDFCPRKYYYRYLLGIKFPKTTALHFGSAVDEALNYY
jgi:hypothetical protein